MSRIHGVGLAILGIIVFAVSAAVDFASLGLSVPTDVTAVLGLGMVGAGIAEAGGKKK